MQGDDTFVADCEEGSEKSVKENQSSIMKTRLLEEMNSIDDVTEGN